MKTQRLSVCLFVLSLFANPMLPRSAAQAKNDPFASPGPAQTTVNPYDWFRVGESLRALGTTTYNYAVADAMKEKYKELRDLFVKVRVSEPTLTAFNAHASAMFDLPWQKNWDQWTEAERAKWTTDPTWQPLDAALSKDRFAMPAAAYFYTMGYQALNIGWFQAWRMDNGAKLADCVPALKGAINDYSWLIAGSSTSRG